MQFSVVIPTCNRNDSLSLCLTRLAPKAQTLPAHYYEVIVSDDGKGITAETMVKSQFPWVRWINGPSRGPAANRNNGARVANGEWLVFTDDDCLPSPCWLEAFFRCIEGANILEGRTCSDRPRMRLDEEAPINLTGGFLWSCNFAVRKSLYNTLGGFDENFLLPAMEDCDLRERLRNLNEKIIFTPAAEVIHPWRRANGWQYWEMHRTAVSYYYKKHHDQKKPEFSDKLMECIRYILKHFIWTGIKYKYRGSKHAISKSLWMLLDVFRKY